MTGDPYPYPTFPTNGWPTYWPPVPMQRCPCLCHNAACWCACPKTYITWSTVNPSTTYAYPNTFTSGYVTVAPVPTNESLPVELL